MEWVELTPATGTNVGDYARARIMNGVFYVAFRNVTRSSSGTATMFDVSHLILPDREVPLLVGTASVDKVTPAWISTIGWLRATWVTGTSYRLAASIPLGM